jgi:hypothetical protein|tara:strand:+ start:492 stop:605 length:114 start_codon:yes stop_codon:yes gene_type:complete
MKNKEEIELLKSLVELVNKMANQILENQQRIKELERK